VGDAHPTSRLKQDSRNLSVQRQNLTNSFVNDDINPSFDLPAETEFLKPSLVKSLKNQTIQTKSWRFKTEKLGFLDSRP
jgi:hypothetical protein